jgi:hypothetical protein
MHLMAAIVLADIILYYLRTAVIALNVLERYQRATAMGSKTDWPAFRRSRRGQRVVRLAPRLQVRRDVDRSRHFWRFRGRHCSGREGNGRSAQAQIKRR